MHAAAVKNLLRSAYLRSRRIRRLYCFGFDSCCGRLMRRSLLGTPAWASKSLVFGIIGHTLMDVGLFGYWLGQIAGAFTQRPISETGLNQAFIVECAILAAMSVLTLIAIVRLRLLSRDDAAWCSHHSVVCLISARADLKSATPSVGVESGIPSINSRSTNAASSAA